MSFHDFFVLLCVAADAALSLVGLHRVLVVFGFFGDRR